MVALQEKLVPAGTAKIKITYDTKYLESFCRKGGGDNIHTICHENSLRGENIQPIESGKNYSPPRKKKRPIPMAWEFGFFEAAGCFGEEKMYRRIKKPEGGADD